MADEHFDAIVVGSGFGGSVMGCRLARAGLSVCLLERGKPYPQHSFPRTPREMRTNFWDPSEGLYGMFNVWAFRHHGALISAGLGGGSLVYANVLIRKDEKWFVREDLEAGGWEHWPVTRADLDPHYERAEKMLNAQRFPFRQAPVYETPKTAAMEEAAGKLGLEFQLPNLAVTFSNPGRAPVPGEPVEEPGGNLHGRTRYTCRLCGECDIGCQYGSKNTLDFNYLSELDRRGGEIRTLCEVKEFAALEGGGYEVFYVEHSTEGPRPADPPRVRITSDRLVLSAGTLGTTFLLMKNRASFPGLSPALGTRFCGNGDLLTIALRGRERRDGTRRPRLLEPSIGPAITCAIRGPDSLDGVPGAEGRGFYIEDAGYPTAFAWMAEGLDVGSVVGRALKFAWRRVKLALRISRDADLSAELSDLIGDAVVSSSSLPLLGMGRDVPDGTLSLSEEGLLASDWRVDRSADFFRRLRGTMEEIAGAWDAEKFLDNPMWHLGRRVTTVHPLGGCPMGRNEREGVVDAWGRVFNHPGLYVADGSVMPGPVGANPSLTIAALADRFADGILSRGGPA